jgi:pSer/pThr/pTyr-binding forkhead associated (FHA) protein
MTAFLLFDVTNSIEHTLSEGETSIGRSEENTIRMLSSSVSRKHGIFTLSDGALSYTDLGSSNGSFINGQAVSEPTPLKHGDNLTLGDFQFNIIQPEATHPAGTDEETQTRLMDRDEGEFVAQEGRPAAVDQDIPPLWSDQAGLENASGTEFFDDEEEDSNTLQQYRAGELPLPPIGDDARLVGLTVAVRGKIFTLSRDVASRDGDSLVWSLGRDTHAVNIPILEGSVSGMHAQIVNEGSRWKVVNWMSTNGTLVNGQRALSSYLKNGDIISMGSAELAFELPEIPAAPVEPVVEPPTPSEAPVGWFKRLIMALTGKK